MRFYEDIDREVTDLKARPLPEKATWPCTRPLPTIIGRHMRSLSEMETSLLMTIGHLRYEMWNHLAREMGYESIDHLREDGYDLEVDYPRRTITLRKDIRAKEGL